MFFQAIDVSLMRPGSFGDHEKPGWGAGPWLGGPWVSASVDTADQTEQLDHVFFSDVGFIDENARVYEPYISTGLTLTRALTLTAEISGTASSVGMLELVNANGILDYIIQNRISDHLPISVKFGRKTFDFSRQIWVDPRSDQLRPLFVGLSKNWVADKNRVSLPLLDASYWLDSTGPVEIYNGEGRFQGDKNVAGRAKPRLRGTVFNATPVLIDAVNYVYQISNAPCDVTSLYEGGYKSVKFSGFVDDIFAVSPEPGTYSIQTGSGGTYIRLGTKPVYAITIDGVGAFKSGYKPTNFLDLLKHVLLEDTVLPPNTLSTEWDDVAALRPWCGGWFWDGSQDVTGKQIITTLLAGTGVTILPTRSGQLRPWILTAPSYKNTSLYIGPDEIISVSAVALDDSLSPITWRWRVGYGHNFTTQTDNLHPQIDDDRKAFVKISDRNALWFDTDIKDRYRVPSDPTAIVTALTYEDDARKAAQFLGEIWGQKRALWAVEIPREIAFTLDLGDTVSITAPISGLREGTAGLVVSEQITEQFSTVTITVLV